MAYDFDIIMIGGGPGGYVAAIRAAQLGKSVCLIEKKSSLGGVCLNEGCIPTKTIIKSVRMLKSVLESEDFGVRGIVRENCYLDLEAVQKRKAQVVSRLTGGVAFLLQQNKVEVVRATAIFESAHAVNVDGRKISAENIIIATGSLPVLPPIPQEGEVPLILSEDALELREVPGATVIIGGGVIGLEFAYIFSQLGSKVTIVETMDEILPSIDPELTQRVRAKLKKLGVEVYTKAKVARLVGREVWVTQQERQLLLRADKVLMATGRRPNIDDLNLAAAGVLSGREGIPVNPKMQTNIPNVYAIGDVTGKYMLAHVASMEGMVAVENISGMNREMDYARIPQGIYLDPEIATVGLSEEEAKALGYEVKIGRFNFAANGKAVLEGEEDGFIKIIIDKRLEEILGVHIMGAHATDMISELTLAMTLEGTAQEVVQTIHPHPTIAEVIPEAFHAVLHRAIHAI